MKDKKAILPQDSNSDQLQVGAGQWFVNFVAQASPATKLIIFYPFAGIFSLFAGAPWLIMAITGVYSLLIPALLIFMPDRVWSEQTMLRWHELGLGHKGSKSIPVEEGELVQPLLKQAVNTTKANIAIKREEVAVK